jgi:hypothetical protein
MSKSRNDNIRARLIETTAKLRTCEKHITDVAMPEARELGALREKHKALEGDHKMMLNVLAESRRQYRYAIIFGRVLAVALIFAIATAVAGWTHVA